MLCVKKNKNRKSLPTYPIFFGHVLGTKVFFLALIRHHFLTINSKYSLASALTLVTQNSAGPFPRRSCHLQWGAGHLESQRGGGHHEDSTGRSCVTVAAWCSTQGGGLGSHCSGGLSSVKGE